MFLLPCGKNSGGITLVNALRRSGWGPDELLLQPLSVWPVLHCCFLAWGVEVFLVFLFSSSRNSNVYHGYCISSVCVCVRIIFYSFQFHQNLFSFNYLFGIGVIVVAACCLLTCIAYIVVFGCMFEIFLMVALIREFYME